MAGKQAEFPLPAGMKKETTRHPPSHRHLSPRVGDEVEVHFTISLQRGGAQIDSSRSSGGPLTYKVGEGAFDGWDRAVQTMKKGEHARFTVAPKFAYGEAGKGDDVPPNSTIVLELELIKCPLREDLFEDGGAVKRQLKEGSESARQPRSGDECQITYKVTVEGCGVAMASQHVVYKLGSERMGRIAQVIDKALLTMKRGDEAMMTCMPRYAFGDGEGKFAGKTATVFVALEEIYEVHDVSLGEKSKTVLRKRTKEGEGSDRVHDTSKVTLRVTSVSSGGESFLTDPRELVFVAGDGEVCDALEGAVLLMKKGDEALVRCESRESCAGGMLGLPDNLETPVMIHIVMVRFDKALEKWDLNGHERILRARQRKEAAAGLFKQGRIRLAAHHYETASGFFSSIDFFQDSERAEAAELRRVCDSNRAMCMLKLGSTRAAESLCTGVLADDPCNVKALFRRAKARVALKDYDCAIEDLQRLLEVEPGSADGRQLLREAKRCRKQLSEQQTPAFSRMCEAFGSMPERTDRRDDDLVKMPDLDAEYAKLCAKHGIKAPVRQDVKREAAPEAAAASPNELEAGGAVAGDGQDSNASAGDAPGATGAEA